MEVFCYVFFGLISTMSWSRVNSAPCLLDRYETPLGTSNRRISRTSSVLESAANDAPDVSPITELPTVEFLTDLVTGGNEVNATDDDSSTVPKEVNATDDDSSTVPKEVNATVDDSSTAPKEVNATDDDSSTVPKEVNATDDDSSTVPSEVNASDDDSSTTPKETNPIDILKASHPTMELASEVLETTTTTESPIKKAAKALAESFHEMSRRLNQTFSLSTTRNGRSGILRLPGSNEVGDYMGIKIPPPMDFGNIRKAFEQLPTLPTLPSLIKPTPPMHTIGISGTLMDGNLHDLARGR